MENKYKLYHGDCLKIMPTLGEVDAVVTDPPYGIADIWKGGSGHGWGNASSVTEERNEWDNKPPTKEDFELIISMANISCIWGGNYFKLPISRGWFIWVKPERNFTLSEAELAWTNQSFPMRVFECRRSDPDRQHPTQKPLSLMKWCVEKLTNENDLILDPFMGSGTTGVACMETGRRFIGVEKERKYYDIAEKRIKNAAAQEIMF